MCEVFCSICNIPISKRKHKGKTKCDTCKILAQKESRARAAIANRARTKQWRIDNPERYQEQLKCRQESRKAARGLSPLYTERMAYQQILDKLFLSDNYIRSRLRAIRVKPTADAIVAHRFMYEQKIPTPTGRRINPYNSKSGNFVGPIDRRLYDLTKPKLCPQCNESKPHTAFGLRDNGRWLRSHCKSCENELNKKLGKFESVFLADRYVKAMIRCDVNDINEITPEMINLKRTVLACKRILKGETNVFI